MYLFILFEVCNSKMSIRYINARQPGSCHDALVWSCSELKQRLNRNKYESGERNSWLLGDAGYPLQPFLMTPFRSTQVGSRQSKYTTAHAKAKNIVERTIGVLKKRFRCLIGARQMHYSPKKVVQITNVCAVLHIICIYYRTDIPLQSVNSIEIETAGNNTENEEPQQLETT